MLKLVDNAPLRPFNTMGINGTAAFIVEWDDPFDLPNLFSSPGYELLRRFPVKQIGEGSNLLFLSDKIDRTLLVSRYTKAYPLPASAGETRLKVGAGVKLDNLVNLTCSEGWWGLENLSHIPGTAGAAAVQNVGAYGVEFGDLVDEVRCYDRAAGRFVTLTRDDLNYSYRDSIFKHQPARDNLIITDVTISLSTTPRPRLDYGNLRASVGDSPASPATVREAVISVRNGKLPAVEHTGSAGSFFKNPVIEASRVDNVRQTASAHGIDTAGMPAFPTGEDKVKLSAAWLIDRAGWKGVKRGNVGTWPSQPLVIVNLTGRATGREVADFAADIIADVEKKYGVKLTPEVEYIEQLTEWTPVPLTLYDP